MDDQVLGEVTAAPWQLRFLTDNFAPGSHTMVAVWLHRERAGTALQ